MAVDVSPVGQRKITEIRLSEMTKPIPMVGLQVLEIPLSGEHSEESKKSLSYLTSSIETRPVVVKFYRYSMTGRELLYRFNANIEFQSTGDKCWNVKDTSQSGKGLLGWNHSKAITYLEAKLNLLPAKNVAIDAACVVSTLLNGSTNRVKCLTEADTNLNFRISKKNYPLTTVKATSEDGFKVGYQRSETCYNDHAPGECIHDTKYARWGKSKDLELELLHETQKTPLLIAVLSGDKSTVELLAQSGASTGFQDFSGNTPLHFVCEPEYRDMWQCLVDASKYGELDVKNQEGISPLHLAINKENNEYALMLIRAGADINLPDANGDRPIHLAVRKNNTNLVSELVKTCMLNVQNTKGFSPLFLAINQNKTANFELIGKLLEAGADPYAIVENGKSAISEAVEKNNLPLLEKLLKISCESKTKEQSLKYALDIAEKKQNPKMMLELLKLLVKLESSTTKLQSPPENTSLEVSSQSEGTVNNETKNLELEAVAKSSFSERICGLLCSAITVADMDVISECIQLINSPVFDASACQYFKVFEVALLVTGVSEEAHLSILKQVYSIEKHENLIGGGRGSIIFAITQGKACAPNHVLKFLFDWATEKSDFGMLNHSYENEPVHSVVNRKCNSSVFALFLNTYHDVKIKADSVNSCTYAEETGGMEGKNMTTLRVTRGKGEPTRQENTSGLSEF
ncbi:hypothetical protein SOPP22_07255 [Shewanella sp. OPT22]|nr:hypothetical protein SOPP22_07255 [Shewanella sp. OPT22]